MIRDESEKLNYAGVPAGLQQGGGERCAVAAPPTRLTPLCSGVPGSSRAGSIRLIARLALLVCCTILIWLASAGAASASLVNQSMTGAAAPGWVIGGSAYLTASTGADPAGSGWLRITEPSGNQAGYGFFDSSFDISQGAIIQFDYATWGGTGADGYSIYLFDGSYDWSTFSVGASGGSLGYAQKSGTGVLTDGPGLSGGYLGIGVDEFGNFSNPTEGRIGGIGATNNSVAVRGPFDHPSGAYSYLGGSNTLAQTLDYANQMYRPSPSGSQYRKVVIYLTPVAAPNYLLVNVYMQFGVNQPLTPVVTGLKVGRQVPASVKVGYGASTGGSTNYHEIRNLVIDSLPTDIDLALTKTASSPTVAQGGSLSYTVTARNYGPSLTTATGASVRDTVPAQLTGVTWTCTPSGGASCGAASGSGNLDTTATLPFNSAAVYTISGTVNPSTPLGTVLSNSATVTPPAGISDYYGGNNSATATTSVVGSSVSVSGMVYSDNGTGSYAHNGSRDTGEGSSNVAAIYAKIFRTSDLSTPLAVTTVNQSAGTYTFAGVPAYGTYTIILSSDNTNSYTPSFPGTQWIYTAPVNFTLANVAVGGSNLANQNFGVYQGSRVSGKVIKDDGFNGDISTAYDGILNAAESGISGVAVQLKDSTGVTVYDTSVTDSDGNFALYTATGSKTLRIYETNPSGYISVNFNPGTTAGSYSIAGDYISFAYTQYADYSGILLSDVPPVAITFTPTPRSASGSASAPVYYAHTFSATGRGSLSFTAKSRSQAGWPAVAYYLDGNCSGSYAAGDQLINAPLTTSAGVPICVIVKETIPSGALNGTTDAIVTRATFSYPNSVGPLANSLDVTDTTTVLASDLSTSTKSWTDLGGAGGNENPGDTLQYTITLKETSGLAAAGVSVSDTISPSFTGFSVMSIPAGATDSSTASTGPLNVSNITVPANGSVSIVFNVVIAPGTAPGTVIGNTAVISNPSGMGGSPAATTVTVSGTAPAGSGNKPLYLYDDSSTPAYKLSRTPMAVTPASYVAIPRGNTTQSWTLSPVLQSGVTLSSGTINVPLWLSTNSSRTYVVPITLRCGATAVASETTQTAALTSGAAAAQFNFTLTLAANYTCAAGNAWRLDVTNTQGTGGTARDIRIYPAPAANSFSRVILPSLNVINVDSVALYTNVAYPGGSAVTTAAPGSTVRIRATISDPFGSYDIAPATGGTPPAITLTDAAGALQVNGVSMTQVFDSGSDSKIYEYIYAVPAGGKIGNWPISVLATEGTEMTPAITHAAYASLPVSVPPVLTVVKTVTPFPATSPGQVLSYTDTVTNTAAGIATGVLLSDVNSPYACWGVNSFGTGVAFQFADGSTPSGLSLGTPVYSSDKGSSWSYAPVSTGGGAPAGYDGNVTNWKIPMNGVMNANGANFSISYKVLLR